MTVADKLTAIAENQQKVFDAGRQAEYDRFWDALQENGSRTNYQRAFCGGSWTDETYEPKYPIIHGAGTATAPTDMFGYNHRLTDTKVGITVMKNNISYLFRGAQALKTVRSLELASDVTSATGTFSGCTALEDILFSGSGRICCDISFRECEKLTHESLVSILGALADLSGGTVTRTLTIGEANIAKLTEEERSAAQEKGWNIV